MVAARPVEAGRSASGRQLANGIALIVSPGVQIPGDANGDSKVDAVDAGAMAQHWGVASGATWAMGDFNKDGAVIERNMTCPMSDHTLQVH